MNNKKPIMFDLDGTLFQVHLISLPAMRQGFETLRERGLWPEVPDDEKIKGVYGMTDKEIWDYLLPGAEPEVKKLAREIIEDNELRNIDLDAGKLFDGAAETLATLAAGGHQLFVVSNGGEDYVKSVCRHHGLAPYLTGIYSAGEYKTETKVQLLAAAVREHKLSPGWMVGDRDSDITAARGNGFVPVACTYGYGSPEEHSDAAYIIENISEILTIVEGS
ncbi:MAG: HAD family hydrolase [Firmicutes bacterium]|nr:HAD family hydrolase [Bacillota bacterium]